ncbi:hypothetical protein BC939DRAFT_503083 [Gamsiella multidivaricata]|uniref:uncharacterized protein n=1 Tax=Gamsiella multidivaricata TaxID=101098 RepID=UPI002220E02B|nr:uncharacterized protein BC939DRAFT_503083 [Gamsiella multidivaricata]KAI7823503.1 hypothetical protein BC939DRAFT_503083 [Gamsiella multidivaricata]
MNTKGQAVNLKILFNRIEMLFADQFKIPSKEAIRLLMKKMGFRYQDVGSSGNFVETKDIKSKSGTTFKSDGPTTTSRPSATSTTTTASQQTLVPSSNSQHPRTMSPGPPR